VEFNVCLDFLKLGINGFWAVFGASKIDECFVCFFWAILFEQPAGTGEMVSCISW
jgi:hypothetical protein